MHCALSLPRSNRFFYELSHKRKKLIDSSASGIPSGLNAAEMYLKMKSISLVCTVHVEAGLANVSELHALLERIRPEVLFLEIPPLAFSDFYETGVRGNLESAAVNRYRDAHRVELVPVDLPAPVDDFFSDAQYFYEKIERQSFEYKRLVDQNRAHVRRYGFEYLNSEYCCNYWSELHKEMQAALKSLDDAKLNDLYKQWNEAIEMRDRAMMTNIQSNCREHSFNKGVFLVGAAHRQSIIEKSMEQHDVHSSEVEWDFSYAAA